MTTAILEKVPELDGYIEVTFPNGEVAKYEGEVTMEFDFDRGIDIVRVKLERKRDDAIHKNHLPKR